MRKPKMWFPNRSDTNRAVQAVKRRLEIFDLERRVIDKLYYSCSKNKGVDQLRSNCANVFAYAK